MTAPARLARVHEAAAGVAEVRVPLRFLSVCSGIEAASCALEPLGFTPVGFAEIDKVASALLARRFPHVRNFGDFTAIDPAKVGPVDWLIGGTPCQAFSIAGKRLSLADVRGNLTLAYAVLAHELARSNGLRGALWENVPGVLNTPDNAFGCFLAALVGSERALIQPRGTGWPNTGMVDGPRARAAWIVRDAQYFGLAQRRERVFVVASFGDGADPAQILFERASLSGNSAPRREARERVAGTLEASAGRRCMPSLTTRTGTGTGRDGMDECVIAHSLTCNGHHSLTCNGVAVAFDMRGREGGAQFEGPHDTANIRAASGGSSRSYVAGLQGSMIGHGDEAGPQGSGVDETGAMFTLTKTDVHAVAQSMAVRRLLPVECERLQGFPDGWTEGQADGPRYRQLGNSMAVPVIRWIGERILASEAA